MRVAGVRRESNANPMLGVEASLSHQVNSILPKKCVLATVPPPIRHNHRPLSDTTNCRSGLPASVASPRYSTGRRWNHPSPCVRLFLVLIEDRLHLRYL